MLTDVQAALARIREVETEDSFDLDDAKFDELTELLGHPSPEVRAAAAAALPCFEAMYSIPTLILERLPAEADPSVKSALLESLGFGLLEEQNRAAEIGRFVGGYEVDNQTDLSDAYNEGVRLLLQLAADGREEESVRAAAVRTMALLSDNPRIAQALRPYLDAREPALRAAALRFVTSPEKAEGIEQTLLALLDDADPEVRRAAARACGFARLEAAADRIRPLLHSSDPLTLGAAWAGLAGTAPMEEAAALLDEILEEVEEGEPLWDDVVAAGYILSSRLEGPDELSDGDEEPGEEAGEDPGAGPAGADRPALSAGGPLPYRRAAPKVGRNDPCPCGSGKKYKKCCGG